MQVCESLSATPINAIMELYDCTGQCKWLHTIIIHGWTYPIGLIHNRTIKMGTGKSTYLITSFALHVTHLLSFAGLRMDILSTIIAKLRIPFKLVHICLAIVTGSYNTFLQPSTRTLNFLSWPAFSLRDCLK